jgi:hypothetical protein
MIVTKFLGRMMTATDMQGAMRIWEDLHVGPIWYGDLTGGELITLTKQGAWGGFHGVFAVSGIYAVIGLPDLVVERDRLVFLNRQIRLVEEILLVNPRAVVRDTTAIRAERSALEATIAAAEVVAGDWITIRLPGEPRPLYSHVLGGRYGRRVGQAVYAVGDDAW